MSRFFCERCDEFWPEDYESEEPGLCIGCADEPDQDSEDEEDREFFFDEDDEEFDDPFA